MNKLYARDVLKSSKILADRYFGNLLNDKEYYDCQFIDIKYQHLLIIGSFKYQVPALKELYKNEVVGEFLNRLSLDKSHLFKIDWDTEQIIYYVYSDGNISTEIINKEIQSQILKTLKNYTAWAGYLNDNGDHIIDLKSPSPGPHFSTNMLLGNRIGFSHPLQTTPKSVVDRFGGGSFRAHAATQVLATRWDMLPEENGFPANRQFYLIENGRQIFYSANAADENIKSATCRHSSNYTEIEYITECGLHIKRRIFILPQYEGLPIATEVQRITITNKS
ncbi:MAG TPA: glycosyl transferase, partial [Mobilitalea sp.]|nr:glycosyl transferase [Mobilitalea sp.]